jgi:hypothetical protein
MINVSKHIFNFFERLPLVFRTYFKTKSKPTAQIIAKNQERCASTEFFQFDWKYRNILPTYHGIEGAGNRNGQTTDTVRENLR